MHKGYCGDIVNFEFCTNIFVPNFELFSKNNCPDSIYIQQCTLLMDKSGRDKSQLFKRPIFIICLRFKGIIWINLVLRLSSRIDSNTINLLYLGL